MLSGCAFPLTVQFPDVVWGKITSGLVCIQLALAGILLYVQLFFLAFQFISYISEQFGQTGLLTYFVMITDVH